MTSVKPVEGVGVAVPPVLVPLPDTMPLSVTSVNKISETDNSLLAPTAENCVTLFTCVRNQSAYRWASGLASWEKSSRLHWAALMV